jgi:hypothetical protein
MKKLSTCENYNPNPLVINNAGPGKSNMDNFIPLIAGGLAQYILPARDIVLIELTAARRSMMSKNLSTDETMAVLSQAL